jgi:hypothetical protein
MKLPHLNPWHLVAAGAVVTFLACAGAPPSSNTPPPPSTSAGSVNLDAFNQLKQGMTYEEATSILGSKGQLSSSSGSFQTYSFPGSSGFSSVVLTFQDGKLTSFTQVGLH